MMISFITEKVVIQIYMDLCEKVITPKPNNWLSCQQERQWSIQVFHKAVEDFDPLVFAELSQISPTGRCF